MEVAFCDVCIKQKQRKKKMKALHSRRYPRFPTVIHQDMDAHCVPWAMEE
jgi:hypothetical protein